MADGIYHDDQFGVLEWDEGAAEWGCLINVPPHHDVGLRLPPEYVTSDEVRAQIRETLMVIKQHEFSFREAASKQIFAENGYHLFWPEERPFDHDVFAHQMQLGTIVFDTEFPDEGISLWYGVGEIVEHVVVVFLSWDGLYLSARDM